MRRNFLLGILILLFVAAPAGVYGQFPSDGESAPDASDAPGVSGASAMPDGTPEFASIETQPELFFQLLPGNAGLFTRFTRYNTSAMRYSRRGYDSRWSLVSVAGIDASSLARRLPDYNILSAATAVSIQRPDELWNSPQGAIRPGGEYRYDISPSLRGNYSRVALYAVNRGYSWGARFDKAWHGRAMAAGDGTATDDGTTAGYAAATGEAANPAPAPVSTPRWSWQLSADRRWGRDPRVGGVFADEGSLLFSAERRGARSTLILTAIGYGGERGLRGYATAEAFALRGDNLYNPLWGYYDGKVRNASVARSVSGLLSARWSKQLSGTTSLEVSAGYMPRWGGRSRLEWYDAPDPRPDYYRYMPSWLGSGAAGDAARDKWLQGESTVTQIDWDGICARNLGAAAGPGPYVLGEAIERSDNVQLAARFTTTLSPKTTLSYGWRAAVERQRNYEKVKDMLGAQPFADVDWFLVDDQVYGDMTLNDANDPGRMVRRGERFGYNYDLDLAQSALFGSAEHRGTDFDITGSVECDAHAFSRVGRFRKEIFADKGSFGRSAWRGYVPMAGSLRANYYLSPAGSFAVTIDGGRQAPLPLNIFLNPGYLDDAIAAPEVAYAGAAIDYRLVAGRVRFNVSLFHTSTWGQTRTYRYWDDLLATYCNMGVSGIDMSNSGVEAAGEVTLSRVVALHGAVALGSYTFASDPAVVVVDDNSRERVSTDRARLGGKHPGGMPATMVSAGVDVHLRQGFMGSLTVNYMDGSYVDPSPLRRTSRAMQAASDPVAMAAQERLPAAATVNLTLYKSLRTRIGVFDLFAAVNNLFSDRGIVYNAYEQMRLSRQRDGSYVPFPSRYLYSYPLTFYLRVGYKF